MHGLRNKITRPARSSSDKQECEQTQRAKTVLNQALITTVAMANSTAAICLTQENISH